MHGEVMPPRGRSRSQFKYALRQCKRSEDTIKADRLAAPAGGLYFERKSTPYTQTILRTWGAYSRQQMPIYAVVIAQMASINTPTIRRLLRWTVPAFWSSADPETWLLDCHWLIAHDLCVYAGVYAVYKNNKSISLKWYANRFCVCLRRCAWRPTQEYKPPLRAYLRKRVYAKRYAYYGVRSINPAYCNIT